MSKLINFAREHRAEFDELEPSAGHLERFAARLNEQPETLLSGRGRSQALKIAAVIVALITGSIFVFDLVTREIRDRFSAEQQGKELPLEIREAIQYYENQSSTQITTIHKLAMARQGADDLVSSAMKNIQGINDATDELEKSLSENPGNEQSWMQLFKTSK